LNTRPGTPWTITGAVTIDSHVTPSGGDNGVISFTVTGSGQIIIRMTGTAGDPITSEIVHWCHDTPADLARLATAKTAEAAGNYNTPEIYNADYLAGYVSNSIPISSMRVMNTMETNDSQVTSWTGASYVPARRPLPGDTNQTTKGLAFEFIVGMANATNSDLWITPPHLADDAYITAIAAYCRDNLNSGLELRVEYSNEGWNALFDQSKWLVQEAVKDWGDDITLVTFTNGSADITVSNNPAALVANGLVVFTDSAGRQNHYRLPPDWNGTALTFTTNRTVNAHSGLSAGKAGGDRICADYEI